MKKFISSIAAFVLTVGSYGGLTASATSSLSSDSISHFTDVADSSGFVAHPVKVSISRSGNAIVEGDVVALNGSELIVRSWGGDWRVLASSLSGDIVVGDSVRVEGSTSFNGLVTVNATIVKNRTRHRDRGIRNSDFGGQVILNDARVSNVDPANHAFWVDDEGQRFLVRANDRTRFVFGNGESGGFNDLKPGMKVNLGALRANDNSNVLALSVSARDINVINNRGDNSSANVDQSATDNSSNDSNNDTDVITDNSDESVNDSNNDTDVTTDNSEDNSIDDSGNSEEDTDVTPFGG